jgi:hypothetical protein
MVPRHVQQRHIEAADQVLEVIEREVAARENDVRPIRAKPVSVKSLVDLVGDREDAQWLAATRA